MAVLLGPGGVGLIGLYTSITNLISTLIGLGTTSSAVRQIAEANGKGDNRRVAVVIRTLRRMSLGLGLAGMLILIALSGIASQFTFSDKAHSLAIATLSAAVFFSAVSSGQTALLQGLRRVKELARLKVFSAMAVAMISIPIIWIWREQGIIPLLIVVSIVGAVFSWQQARRISVETSVIHWKEHVNEARSMIGFGLVFLASGLMTALVTYLSRFLVARELGVEAAGHYTSAYTLAAIYAGFILQAMGSDFFPRLTAVAEDNITLNRMVNEQAEIALLIAVPGILATLALAPWVIHVFYAASFEPAIPILQWQALGIMGRILSWPMGFILLAKAKRAAFFWTEFMANAFHILAIFVGLHLFGLVGAGMAFAGLYLFYTIVMIIVSAKVSGFHWSSLNIKLLSWMLPAVLLVFVVNRLLSAGVSLSVSLLTFLSVGWVCFYRLLARLPPHQLQRLREYTIFRFLCPRQFR